MGLISLTPRYHHSYGEVLEVKVILPPELKNQNLVFASMQEGHGIQLGLQSSFFLFTADSDTRGMTAVLQKAPGVLISASLCRGPPGAVQV